MLDKRLSLFQNSVLIKKILRHYFTTVVGYLTAEFCIEFNCNKVVDGRHGLYIEHMLANPQVMSSEQS